MRALPTRGHRSTAPAAGGVGGAAPVDGQSSGRAVQPFTLDGCGGCPLGRPFFGDTCVHGAIVGGDCSIGEAAKNDARGDTDGRGRVRLKTGSAGQDTRDRPPAVRAVNSA